MEQLSPLLQQLPPEDLQLVGEVARALSFQVDDRSKKALFQLLEMWLRLFGNG